MFWLHKPLNVNRPNYLEIYSPPEAQVGVALGDTISEESRVDGVRTTTIVETVAATNITDMDAHPPFSDKISVRSWSNVTSGLYWGMEDPVIGIVFTPIRKLVHLGQRGRAPRTRTLLIRILLTIFDYLLKKPFCYAVAPFLDLVDDSATLTGATYVPPYYAMKIPTTRWWIMWYPSCIVAFVFGAVHFLAWNSHFPTPTEQTFWRISTATLIVVPFDLLIVGVAFDVHDRWKKPKLGKRTRVAVQVNRPSTA
ncbi:hypothetical protein BDN72DRAFT_884335 [Pluteus cervinus]|uniref:Uncharacterized protein n=1 Tax=Pluteus cervinus TaxID=181527 RepID=A0ACD2ZWM0_9AGAR|nr:hypothetical protein BDN72DRAFT_884335 [Pluteus cervinus]